MAWMRYALCSCWLVAASGNVVRIGPPARCNSDQVMPTTRDACMNATRALGVEEFRDHHEDDADGPLCGVLDNEGGVQGIWNAAGRADSSWGGPWQAVCTCIGAACTSDSAPPPSASTSPSRGRSRDRGENQLGSMLMTLPLLLVIIPLTILKIKYKRRRAEMRRQAAGAQMQQPQVAVPAGSMMVACPHGVKPGDAIMVAMLDGQQVQVQVPPGVAEGGQFMVQAPVAPVVVQATVVGPAL